MFFHPARFRRARCGFSLLEMLVVLALIAVMSGVCIGAYFGTTRERVLKASHQRNAQEIVSMGVYATLGDAQFVVPDDKAATVQNLVDGTPGESGTWKGKIFRVTMTPESAAQALPYVKFDGQVLLYEPRGGQQ